MSDVGCVCGHDEYLHIGDCRVVGCLCPIFVTRADLEAPDPTPRHVRRSRVRAWFRGRTGDTRARTEGV